MCYSELWDKEPAFWDESGRFRQRSGTAREIPRMLVSVHSLASMRRKFREYVPLPHRSLEDEKALSSDKLHSVGDPVGPPVTSGTSGPIGHSRDVMIDAGLGSR